MGLESSTTTTDISLPQKWPLAGPYGASDNHGEEVEGAMPGTSQFLGMNVSQLRSGGYGQAGDSIACVPETGRSALCGLCARCQISWWSSSM